MKAVLTLFAVMFAMTAAASEFTSENYDQLITTLPCKQDKQYYGLYYDYGEAKAGRYCGQDAPAGFWEYSYPDWYVYKKRKVLSDEEALKKASVNGVYAALLKKIAVPGDEEKYGKMNIYGHWHADVYNGHKTPAGHWVYVAPHWYIWGDKDLARGGWGISKKTVKTMNGDHVLQIEYRQKNKKWAQEQLETAAVTVKEIEMNSGIPFPGRNPYPMVENPALKQYGQGSRDGMAIASPPHGTPWTVSHELIHAWNASVRPKWINEGQANFISYIILKKHNLPFYEEDGTFSDWVQGWHDQRKKGKDAPLFSRGKDKYTDVHQGKAMAFWANVYELRGMDFVYEAFKAYHGRQEKNNALFVKLLKTHGVGKPRKLLSGWIQKGPYLVKKAKDAGAVTHIFPEALPGW